ncbi:DNA topoisomerase (ATP-hydrolyzing) subunit A [Clostridium sp. ZBS18]|uniref:DNA gyrase subunit A n=1 Tax=Clostridium sp. ZBS18 TaxID=2949967 RepID=UPI00207AE9C2|nr:DNA topoisomerase (ATP-hydrolyzing) subunit A [Clostridium sp. ZBS18]
MGTVRTYTIEKDMTRNYFCYGMCVISERALPRVEDGFLPVQRKLLYSMKNSGFTSNKKYAKTLDVIGSTTPIYVHGDGSLAGAMSLLVDTNETQKTPYLEGDGNFGNIGTTNSYSAPRYTSARLSKFSDDNLFEGLEKNVVKFVGESEHPEPLFLPTKYPNILVISLMGIAVGMGCNFNGFNLKDVCEYTIKYISDNNLKASDYLIPDFNDNCELIYNKKGIQDIANTGRGSIKVRGKYKVEDDMLSIYVPYSITVQSVVNDITNKLDKLKGIIDVRDGTGFNNETKKEEYIVDIDVKKGTNVSKLMSLLYKYTQLETSINYNMNCLIDNQPKTRGVNEILDAWIKTREDCIKEGLQFDLNKLNKKLHLLYGLRKVLLDTDKAIEIIKNTEEDNLINNNLIEYFNIDNEQAENVANLKLRNINKNYIINQIKVIENLEIKIKELQFKINNKEELDRIIISDINNIIDKYGKPRQTEIIYEDTIAEIKQEDLIEDYTTTLVLTEQQYFKKTKKYSENQKLKEDDNIKTMTQDSNKNKVMFLSDKGNMYLNNLYELDENTPSSLGQYLPNLLPLDKDETILGMISSNHYNGYVLIVYEDGHAVKIPLESYKTKTNRTKLSNCLADITPILITQITDDINIELTDTFDKTKIIKTEDIPIKTSRNSQGKIMWCSKKQGFKVVSAQII